MNQSKGWQCSRRGRRAGTAANEGVRGDKVIYDDDFVAHIPLGVRLVVDDVRRRGIRRPLEQCRITGLALVVELIAILDEILVAVRVCSPLVKVLDRIGVIGGIAHPPSTQSTRGHWTWPATTVPLDARVYGVSFALRIGLLGVASRWIIGDIQRVIETTDGRIASSFNSERIRATTLYVEHGRKKTIDVPYQGR